MFRSKLTKTLLPLTEYHNTFSCVGKTEFPQSSIWSCVSTSHIHSSKSSSRDVAELIKCVDSSFMDLSKSAYAVRTNGELLRSMLVYGLCSVNSLVQNNQKILKLSRQVFGEKLHEKLLKATFYGHFVLGYEENEAKSIIDRYAKYGVYPILYYALEEDKNESSGIVANDRFYNMNTEKFKQSIDTVSKSVDNIGYIAVKPTALGSPYLWLRVTDIIKNQTPSSLTSQHINVNLLGELETKLTEQEHAELQKVIDRASDIVQHGISKGVGIMIDAEQTYFQPAIRHILGIEMMKRFNKDKIHVISTYQTYLKNAYDIVRSDIGFCKQNDIGFGIRIVRGAYLDQERLVAQREGYPDPTNPSFEATTEMYHKVSELVLQNMTENTKKFAVKAMFASHNEATIQHVLQRLEVYKPPIEFISFGQLYGMSDHITFHLGEVGFPVYKSMPFGPLEVVTSYLGRRAVENRGVLDKVKKERQLLNREFKQRYFTKPSKSAEQMKQGS